MEEHGEIHEAFRLVSAIKEIVQCRSSSALTALKNVIDDRLRELDGIEQNIGFTGQTGVETGQTGVKIEQTPSKTEQKKKTKIYEQAIYPEDQIMERYGTTTVYKPVVDVILEKTDDRFGSIEIAKIIEKHYNKTLERNISVGSAGIYTSRYIKYMLSKGLIERDEKRKYKFKKCTAVQKKDVNTVEEKDRGIPDISEREDRGLKKHIEDERQFLNEVCG